MAVYETGSRAETAALGERLAKVLRSGSLVLFTGGLGAGKTAFCEGIARGLGCTDEVSSPTFAIVNVYRGPQPFAHFDMYRISTMEDLQATGFFDYLDDGARAAKDCGFRYVFCDSINNFGGTVAQMEKDYLRFNTDEKRQISHRIGFHAEYTTSRELMEEVAALAHKYQAPVSVHCSETRKEVEECRAHSGMTPVAYMDSLGLFEYGGTLFHGVHMDEDDFRIIRERGIYVVTNPASNLKLASGIAPIKRYLEEGIPLAIGTDGPASNNCLDMFREMFLTTGLQKAVCEDPEAVPAIEVLKMATTGGAHAMGLSECDCIQAGKKADLILIDLNQPNMQPLRNLEKNLVYSGSKQNVKMTMVGGNVLYQDGEFYLDCPKEEIFEKANEIAQKILGE